MRKHYSMLLLNGKEKSHFMPEQAEIALILRKSPSFLVIPVLSKYIEDRERILSRGAEQIAHLRKGDRFFSAKCAFAASTRIARAVIADCGVEHHEFAAAQKRCRAPV